MSGLDKVIAQLAQLDPLVRIVIDSDVDRWRREVCERGGPKEAQWIVRRVGGP